MLLKNFNVTTKRKISSFNKVIKVDTDKSMSIRSFLIGAISHNISSATNVLESEDVLATINCLKKLGVKITRRKSGSYFIFGKGLGSLNAKKGIKLNFGNSGTLARLLIGILSTNPNIEVELRGDHSLNKRSMKKLIELMSQFGALFLPKKKKNPEPKVNLNLLTRNALETPAKTPKSTLRTHSPPGRQAGGREEGWAGWVGWAGWLAGWADG